MEISILFLTFSLIFVFFVGWFWGYDDGKKIIIRFMLNQIENESLRNKIKRQIDFRSKLMEVKK